MLGGFFLLGTASGSVSLSAMSDLVAYVDDVTDKAVDETTIPSLRGFREAQSFDYM